MPPCVAMMRFCSRPSAHGDELVLLLQADCEDAGPGALLMDARVMRLTVPARVSIVIYGLREFRSAACPSRARRLERQVVHEVRPFGCGPPPG